MSDFESAAGIDKIVEGNPAVDRNQLSEAWEAVATLRRSGLTRPSYRLDSPYERSPIDLPESSTDEGDDALVGSLRR